MNQFISAFTLFLSLLVEAMPFLLLGVLFSGILLFFVDERKLIEVLPRNPFLGALCGSLIGFLFPVCECGNVPVARRLLMQGVPTSVSIGFLLAAPTINPIVIWSTWTAFRDQPEIVVLRVVFSLLVATTVGWIFSVQPDMRSLLQPSLARAMPSPRQQTASPGTASVAASPLLQSGTFLLAQPGQPLRLDTMAINAGDRLPLAISPPTNSRKPFWDKVRLLIDNTVLELRELGGILVLGSAIAAILQVAVPREIVLSVGHGPVTSILAMLVLAAIISICSTVDAFFALSFASAFTSGSLLAFLVFGPMIDLKGVGLMLSIFKPRPVIYLFVLAGQLTFLLTLIYNLKIG